MAIPFVQAKYFTHTDARNVDLVVVHTMEAPEKTTTAEAVARYFQNPPKKVSAHYCVDADSTVQCVRERDVAYHAPGANHNGIGVEHAGYAGQGTTGWADEYSQAMLRRSAELVRDICRRHAIPVAWLSAGDVKAGMSGITSHHNVSLAFRKSDHWDPGPDFPVEQYLSLIRGVVEATPGVVDEMKLYKLPDAENDPSLYYGPHWIPDEAHFWIMVKNGMIPSGTQAQVIGRYDLDRIRNCFGLPNSTPRTRQ